MFLESYQLEQLP